MTRESPQKKSLEFVNRERCLTVTISAFLFVFSSIFFIFFVNVPHLQFKCGPKHWLDISLSGDRSGGEGYPGENVMEDAGRYYAYGGGDEEDRICYFTESYMIDMYTLSFRDPVRINKCEVETRVTRKKKNKKVTTYIPVLDMVHLKDSTMTIRKKYLQTFSNHAKSEEVCTLFNSYIAGDKLTLDYDYSHSPVDVVFFVMCSTLFAASLLILLSMNDRVITITLIPNPSNDSAENRHQNDGDSPQSLPILFQISKRHNFILPFIRELFGKYLFHDEDKSYESSRYYFKYLKAVIKGKKKNKITYKMMICRNKQKKEFDVFLDEEVDTCLRRSSEIEAQKLQTELNSFVNANI